MVANAAVALIVSGVAARIEDGAAIASEAAVEIAARKSDGRGARTRSDDFIAAVELGRSAVATERLKAEGSESFERRARNGGGIIAATMTTMTIDIQAMTKIAIRC